jgi:hypothetical protein
VLDVSDIAAAPTSPRFETEEEARQRFPGLTRDEYALARAVNSEAGSRPALEMACIADAIVNAARGKSVFAHVTGGAGYGPQKSPRPVTTDRDPGPRHVVAALAVLRPPAIFGQAVPLLAGNLRGCSHGATRFLNVKAQDELNRSGSPTHRPAVAVLESWTYSRRFANDAPDGTLKKERGGGQLEWVGHIPGVDAYRGVMLLRPATAQQDLLFSQARRIIESKGAYQGLPFAPIDVAVLVAFIGATYLVAHGVV